MSCLNPRLPHGRRHDILSVDNRPLGISIHASLTGGDGTRSDRSPVSIISIHAPLTGGDEIVRLLGEGYTPFQSTPPSREATVFLQAAGKDHQISIHAPLTGGDESGHRFEEKNRISIHAPLTGGDFCVLCLLQSARNFNPRPLTGGDGARFALWRPRYNFNPRPPHGRRPVMVVPTPDTS